MVATLMKHEIKRTTKPLLVFIGIGFLVQLLASLGMWLTSQSAGISGFFILLDLLGIAVVAIGPVAYLVVDYWRTNYTTTGYLTQTIPAPGATKYWTKLFWSAITLFISAGLTLASIVWLLAIFGIIKGHGGFGAPVRNTFSVLHEILSMLPGGLMVAIICYLIILVLTEIIPLYFSISVGFEAWARRLGKFGGPIVTWVGYYVVCQLLGVISIYVLRLGISLEPGTVGSIVTYSIGDFIQGANPVMPLTAFLIVPILAIILAVRTAYSWNKKVTLS